MLIAEPTTKATLLHNEAQAGGDGVILRLNPRAENGVLQIDGGGAAVASGVLTLTVVPVEDEVVVLGDLTYTFKDALTGAAYEVLNGSGGTSAVNTEQTLANLVAAIRSEGTAFGEGTTYGHGTIENVLANAAAGAGLTLDATAKARGVAGNAIPCTTNVTGGSWAAATLLGGTAFVATLDPYVSLGGDYWNLVSCTPVGGGAGVTTFTTVGQWNVPVRGMGLLRVPISAYTSGLVTARFMHMPSALS